MHLPRWKRDSIIVSFALGLGTVEALLLGARASTFTFCLGLLVLPVVLRADEARKDDP